MDIRIINISNGPHEMNSEAANTIDFNKLSLETTARLRYSDQSDYVGFQIDLMIMQDKVQMFKSGFLVGLTVEGWSEDLQKGLDLNNNRSKLPEICKTVWMVAKGDIAIPPRIARLSADMTALAEQPRPIIITDSLGNELTEDNPHRFFEAPWIHRYGDKYYLTYSTGGTHYICYAVADSPYGPYVCKGEILTPVVGWTTHQSIVEKDGRWYLFYHDSTPSGGVSSLRSTKVTPLTHRPDGSIVKIDGGKKKK